MAFNRSATPKTPHPVDKSVGLNIRRVRRERRLSQEALAAAIGLTFQQLQKYERGTNRVSCSRLCEIAQALRVEPADLLPEIEGVSQGEGARLRGFRQMQNRLLATLNRLTPRQARILLLTADAMAPRRRA